MRNAFHTPDNLPTDTTCRRFVLPDSAEWLGLLRGALSLLCNESNWDEFGAVPVEDVVQEFRQMMRRSELEGVVCMIGDIVPSARAAVPLFGLLCDGTQYARVDYPELYAVLDSAFIVDADNFIVPDLRDKFLRGAGADVAGDTGGADDITLTVNQMPSHSHTTQPHSHTTQPHTHTASYPSVGIDLEAPGAPDFTAVGNPPTPVVTGAAAVVVDSAGVTVDSAGGDESFDNRPAYYVLKFYIVAV